MPRKSIITMPLLITTQQRIIIIKPNITMRVGSMKMPSTTRQRLKSIANKLTNIRAVRTLILKNRVFGIREFASGDTAVLELVWKGVHTGPMQTPTGAIPPSNKPIEVPACQIVRVEGEKIKSSSQYFDMLALLTQIGTMQSAAPAKSAA
jgi:hypothetical protein